MKLNEFKKIIRILVKEAYGHADQYGRKQWEVDQDNKAAQEMYGTDDDSDYFDAERLASEPKVQSIDDDYDEFGVNNETGDPNYPEGHPKYIRGIREEGRKRTNLSAKKRRT